MPSPDYRNAGHGSEYGNKQGTPQLDFNVKAVADDGSVVSAEMWIKAARNEGLSVHVPSGNSFVSILRDRSREFSAYIPGLAGIPLSEEKRTKLIVQRLAAAGDANTVLRNILLLLKDVSIDKKDGLSLLVEFVSKVMGDVYIEVEFDEDRSTVIEARFQTADMRKADAKRFKPLELAGIGFLQVIQIFAYIIYFRPVVVLVDEPDSHLHPTAQERLIIVLAAAAKELKIQVIISTHSPSVARALPSEARVIWMKDGKVQEKGDTEGRSLMGWGLLDRKALLMTEDKDAGMIQALLAQWPDLDRKIAVWPFYGSSKLPGPEVISGLIKLTGGDMKVVLHRDRDFLMPPEVDELSKPYRNFGHDLWFTRDSDMEAYWAKSEVIADHFSINENEAEEILLRAMERCCIENADLKLRRKKRVEAINKIKLVGQGELPQYGDTEVTVESTINGPQFKILGKDLVGAIRDEANKVGLKNYQDFGSSIPPSFYGLIAEDLRTALESALN